MRHLPRTILATFLLLSLSVASSRADLDRAKKAGEEKEARPELERGARPGQSHEDYHRQLIEEGKSNLAQIQKLLDEIQGDLAQRQTGSETQQKQQQVVERLTRLIEEMAKGCQACKSAQSQSPQSGGGGQKPQQQTASGEKEKQTPEARENQKDLSGSPQQKEEDGQKEDNRDALPNDQVADGENPESADSDLGEAARKTGAWGFLPPKVRDEMLSASGKEAPLEYREIIDRYYKRISDFYEKAMGRRASD